MTARGAILWEFRRRHRWGALALGVYLLLLAAFKMSVIASGTTISFNDSETFALVVVVPMTITFLYALAVFTHGFVGDVAARQSMYPARLFTLPVSNSALAGWPMLYGVVTLMLLWVVTRTFVIWPSEFTVPYVWPATLAAALVSWAQAFVWMPYGLPGARVVVAMLWLTSMDTIVFVELQYHAPEWMVVAFTAPQVPLAYLTARYAVMRAREGVVPDWSWMFAWLKRGSARVVRHFDSPEQAQAWFEWRRHGLALPFVVALLLPFELLVLKAAGNTGLVLLILGAVVVTPPFMAAFVAATVASAERGTRDAHGLSAFMATRPLTSAAMIAAKLEMTVWSTLLTWALVLVAIPLGVRWTGATPAVIERWHKLIAFMGEPRAIALVAGIVALCALTTWRQLVQTMYISLTGRDWVVKGYVALTLAVVCVLGPMLEWIGKSTDVQRVIWDDIPVLLGVLATAKVALALWVTLRLSRSDLVRHQTLVAGAAVWCAAVFAVSAALRWFIQTDLVPHARWVFAAILIVPLARLSASPLALAWNRHR